MENLTARKLESFLKLADKYELSSLTVGEVSFTRGRVHTLSGSKKIDDTKKVSEFDEDSEQVDKQLLKGIRLINDF